MTEVRRLKSRNFSGHIDAIPRSHSISTFPLHPASALWSGPLPRYPFSVSQPLRPPWFSATLALAAALVSPLSALPALLLLPGALRGAWQRAMPGSDRFLTGWMAGWLLWLPFSQVFSLSPGWALSYLGVLCGLPLAWLAGNRLASLGLLDGWLIRVVTLLLLVLTGWGWWQGPDTLTHKPQGPFNDPNLYAASLNLLLLPVLAHWLAATPRFLPRLAGLALLGSSLLVFFLVASRGAGLSLLLTLPILFLATRHLPHARRKWGAFLLVALVAALAAQQVHEGSNLAARLAHTVRQGDSPRWMLLQSAWAMVQEHPWVGQGLGSFRLLYPRYRHLDETISPGGWVHNDYLQVWVEAGLPLLLLLLGLAWRVAGRVWREVREKSEGSVQRLGYLLGVAVILLHAHTNFILYFSPVLLLLGLYLARSAPPLETARPAIALRLAGTIYGLGLGYLLVVLLAVEILLTHGLAVQHRLMVWGLPYSRVEIARTLAHLAPPLPAPHESLAIEALADLLFNGTDPNEPRQRYIAHLEAAQQRVPCHTHYTLEILEQLRQMPASDSVRAQARQHIQRVLDCHPRHGLAYYRAGQFADPAEAPMWWRAGLAAVTTHGERLLLASALLATRPGDRERAESLAFAIKQRDGYPSALNQRELWLETHYALALQHRAAYPALLRELAPGLTP